MIVQAPRSGKVNVFFDKEKVYTTLASSTQGGPGADKYDPPKNRFRDGEEERKKLKQSIKQVHKDSDFKMANYPEPSTGSGSLAGTFQQKQKPYEHIGHYTVLKRGEPAKIIKEFPARNFLTNPGKKGSYGVPNTTIGKEGFISLYVVTPELQEYRRKEEERWAKKKAEFQKQKKDLLERPTFKGMAAPHPTFDHKKGSTGVTAIYDEYEPSAEKLKIAEKEAKIRAKAAKRKAKEEARKNKGRKIVPLPEFMKYSSKNFDTRYNGCFNAFPDQSVVPNPDVFKKREEAAAKKAEAERRAAKKKGGKGKIEHPEWKPVSGAKSSCTSSLLPRYY